MLRICLLSLFNALYLMYDDFCVSFENLGLCCEKVNMQCKKNPNVDLSVLTEVEFVAVFSDELVSFLRSQ